MSVRRGPGLRPRGRFPGRSLEEARLPIITSPAFEGDRILAAILFENTMARKFEGRSTSDDLWGVKEVVPILKVDQGLAEEAPTACAS